MKIAAWSKLNLFLAIGNQHPDGYHELTSVFQTISLHDDLLLDSHTDAFSRNSCSEGDFQIIYDSNYPEVEPLAWDAQNTLYRTVVHLTHDQKSFLSMRIRLIKRIPTRSGLGGGSADAGALIRHFGKLWALSEDRQIQIARTIGSDVPFFLKGGTALVQGTGERVTALSPLPSFPVLLVRPSISLSTSDMYRRLDQWRAAQREVFLDAKDEEKKALDTYLQLRQQKPARCRNDFLPTLHGIHPVLDRWIPQWEAFHHPDLLAKGMTGSGSVFFAVFHTRAPFDQIQGLQADWQSQGYWSSAARFLSEEDIDLL